MLDKVYMVYEVYIFKKEFAGGKLT
jgi:hypothetical protein